MITAAKNGCNNKIKFQKKYVYYECSYGIDKSTLGEKLDKVTYLNSNVDESNFNAVQTLLYDWELYENGWYIKSYYNKHLYYYLCQIGSGQNRPKELSYFF